MDKFIFTIRPACFGDMDFKLYMSCPIKSIIKQDNNTSIKANPINCKNLLSEIYKIPKSNSHF